MSLRGLGSIKRLEDDGREGGQERAMKREMGVDREGEEAVSNRGVPWMDWSC